MPPRVFAAVFTLLGLTAVVVGIHDASVARGNLGALIGAMFLVGVGVVALVAAGQLLSKRTTGGDLVLVAFALQALLGVYVFFTAIGAPGSQRPVAVVAGALLVGVAAWGLVVFRASLGMAGKRLGFATALTVAVTLIGFWQFWYQNQYVPGHAGRAVSLAVQLTPAGVQGGFDVVRATIGYQDVGARDVTVIGSTYTLTGSRVVRCTRSPTPKAVQQVLSGYSVDPQRSRYMTDVWEEQPASLLAAGKFVADGKRLDANVPATRRLLFFVPRGRFQLLRLRAQLFAISASVPLLPKKSDVTFPGDGDLYAVWTVADNSWFHDLVNGQSRWVISRYEDVSEPAKTVVSPDFRVTARFPAPAWSAARPAQATIQSLFDQPSPSDSSEPFGDDELALQPVAAPTAADRGKLPATC